MAKHRYKLLNVLFSKLEKSFKLELIDYNKFLSKCPLEYNI